MTIEHFTTFDPAPYDDALICATDGRLQLGKKVYQLMAEAGYAIVPREPTEAMMLATANNVHQIGCDMAEAWRIMIEAALTALPPLPPFLNRNSRHQDRDND